MISYSLSLRVLGFTMLAGAVFFFGGLNLLALGIVGQYIARIFREIKGRPLYIVETILTSDQPVSAEKPQRGSGYIHPRRRFETVTLGRSAGADGGTQSSPG